MKDADILFCRKAVVNRLSETTAYYVLHPSNVTQGQDASFLSSLFVDANLNEITQQKTIFFQTSLNELSALPLQTNIHMVIFLCANDLTEKHIETLTEFRLQGYQLGIINPNPEAFTVALLSVFSYVMLTLDHLSVDDALTRFKHPALSSKKLWVNKVEKLEQFTKLLESIPEGQFSGNFINKITSVKGKRVLAYQAILIDLLVALKEHANKSLS
ncbi:MAG: hypothetical protein ACTH5B_15650 [Marinomonas sp.]|uniref:hypothetical protein n=1 Tax=Marinomonas sp. TaxID=1904862 RepID=UPI003F982499